MWRLLVPSPLPSLGDDMGRTHSHHYHMLDLTKATSSPLVCHGSPSQPRGGGQHLDPSRLQLEKDAGTSGWVDQFGFGCYLATSWNSCPSPPGWIPLLESYRGYSCHGEISTPSATIPAQNPYSNVFIDFSVP